MKVKIGPYIRWIGPYQIANALLLWPANNYNEDTMTWRERMADRLGDWLARKPDGSYTKLTKFCNWVHSKRERQVYVHIDGYDVWNMDDTLRLIIGPMFVKLRDVKRGSGRVDDCDVPEHLQSTSAPKPENEWDLDANFHKRYEWLLDEMVWAFNTNHDAVREKFYNYDAVDETADVNTQVQQLEVNQQALEAHEQRLTNAYRLFGKYYQTFWD